jgi:hypothetical protein
LLLPAFEAEISSRSEEWIATDEDRLTQMEEKEMESMLNTSLLRVHSCAFVDKSLRIFFCAFGRLCGSKVCP